jgi:hypothetical protein
MDFPIMPSTSLSLGAQGRIEDATFRTLTFTNAVTYEPYEPAELRPQIPKVVHIGANGVLSYQEPKVGFVSTTNFLGNSLTSFLTSNGGGPGIQDILSDTPDTYTNALAKLDAWIGQTFIQQPPAITPAETEVTSLYAGVRWLNFNRFPSLNTYIPYVSKFMFTIGDPESDHCTLELTNSALFPYKSYQDGISPEYTPLVRIRIFTDFFLQSAYADALYNKSALPANSIRVVSETGNATLPTSGNVVAFNYTNNTGGSYTTLSIYLPSLKTTYPKDTNIPVTVSFQNDVEAQRVSTSMTAMISSVGAPSIPSTCAIGLTGISTFAVTLRPPVYSDTLAQISTPYLSFYSVRTTITGVASSNVGGEQAFRYGVASTSNVPGGYDNYSIQYTYPYVNSNSATSYMPVNVLAGTVWSTIVRATNSADLTGPAYGLEFTSTLMPSTSAYSASNLSTLVLPTPFVRSSGTAYNMAIDANTLSWYKASPVTNDVMFVSTGTIVQPYLSTPVQLNHFTYPGCRSNTSIDLVFIGNGDPYIETLVLSTFNDDYTSNTPLNYTNGSNILSVNLSDQYKGVLEKYYYNAQISSQYMLTQPADTTSNAFTIRVTNRDISGNTLVNSAGAYNFTTEPIYPASTGAILGREILSTSYVSGLLTPALGARFYFDLFGTNILYRLGASNFGHGTLHFSTMQAGGCNQFTSNVICINNTINRVLSAPFSENTPLRISSCYATLTSNIFNNPANPQSFSIRSGVTAANPVSFCSTLTSTLANTLYVDTVSLSTLSQFTRTSNTYGKRIPSYIPRTELAITASNIFDSVTPDGVYGQGLNISTNTLMAMTSNNVFLYGGADYLHSLPISTFHTDPYSRELLYMNGTYRHPVGQNFSAFNKTMLYGNPSGVYPNFTNDLAQDSNGGFRYATFLYETSTFTATPVSYMNVRFHNPSLVSPVTMTYASNAFFPRYPVSQYLMNSTMTRMHAKLFGAYNVGVSTATETAWMNGFKELDDVQLVDSVYDTAACADVTMDGNDVIYKTQFEQRCYTKIAAAVRIGISRDAPNLTFDAISVSFDNGGCTSC